MLFGGFAPPAARQTSAVFFIVIAPTEILHFYLELADEPAETREGNVKKYDSASV